MKISKRIFSLLVSLLVITSSVGVATATETTETTDEIKHIEFTLDASTIGKIGDTVGENWLGGYADISKKGFQTSGFSANSDYVTFTKIKDDGYVGNTLDAYIPVSRRETTVNDSYTLKAGNELTLNLDSKTTESIKFVTHVTTNINATVTVKYTDNTEENFTVLMGEQGQTWAHRDRTTYPYSLGTKGLTYRHIGIDSSSESKTLYDTSGNNVSIGITMYHVSVDKDKTPQSVTIKNTNASLPIFLYDVAQDFFTNADMKLVIDEVKAYETGIAYTSAQIEKIELAKKYATELSISDSDFEAIYAIAMKQKYMAGTNYIDISKDFDISTIGKTGEKVGENWFKESVENVRSDDLLGKGDYLDFVEYQDYDGESVKTTGKTVYAYIPEKVRHSSENDSVNIVATKSYSVDLNAVSSKNISFVFNANGGSVVGVKVMYSDGTSFEKDVKINDFGQLNAYKNGPNQYASGRIDYPCFTAIRSIPYTVILDSDGQTLKMSSNWNGGLMMYKVDLDTEKMPKSVEFTNKNTDTTKTTTSIQLYAVNQNPMATTTEMTTAIETAKELKDVTRMLTSDEITTIENAKKYSSTLVEVGVGTASDYAFLDTVLAKAEKQKALFGVTHIDISDKYNADTIASAGDTVGDSWFAGYNAAGNFGGFTKSGLAEKEKFQAKTYSKTQTGTDDSGNPTYSWTEDSETVEVYIPNVGRNGGENDAVALMKTKSPVEIKLNEVYTKSIRYLFHSGDSTVKWTVYYKDGTSETAQKWYNTYASHYYGTRTGIPMLNTIGGQFLYKGTDNKLESKSATVGMLVHEIALDETKIADKVVFEGVSNVPTMLYSVSQVPVTYTEMTTALETGLENGVLTAEDETLANKLISYNDILVSVGINDYNEKCNAYKKQINAQKTSYVDLKDYVNADLMVKAGDTYSDSDEAKLSRTIELFNSGSIKSDILTVVAPSTGLYADDASQIEVGRTYKLSGAYDGKGNDVVKVEKDSTNASTITLPETIGTVNGIGVILDCNHGQNQPVYNEEGACYTNKGTNTGRKVTVTVNYTDGTSEDKQVVLVKSTAYQMSKFYANAGSTNRMDYVTTDDGTSKIQLMSGGGMNYPFFYSSNVEFDTSKTVKSLTFNSNSNGDYNIIAISQFVQTNAEVMNIFANEDPEIYENSDITSENVDASIKWLSACIELYERGFYDIITEEDCQAFGNMLAYAKALKKGNVGFTAEISVSDDGNNKKATFTMSNMADKDQNYVLVIAAYVGNKLVGFNVSETSGTVTAGETNKTDSISMAKSTETGVTYKAFVWESLSSLKALGTSN